VIASDFFSPINNQQITVEDVRAGHRIALHADEERSHGMTNQIAVSWKQKSPRSALLFIGKADVDETYRLRLAATPGTRDARNPNAKGRRGTAADSCSHCFRNFGANGPVPLDQFPVHPKQVDLRFICVGNDAFKEILGATGHIGDASREKAASATLGGRKRVPAGS
jgi:hypothetical protein